MAHVANVDQAAQFYSLLGYSCVSRFADEDGGANWCSLYSNTARIMLSRACEPVISSQQAVLFYMYSENVAGLRQHLLSQGVRDGGVPDFELNPTESGRHIQGEPVVFEIQRPFYMPEGELRIHDLDGYVILVGQLG